MLSSIYVMENERLRSFIALKLVMKGIRNIYGLDPGKYREHVRRAGTDYGSSVSNLLISTKLDSLIEELVNLWNEYELGSMDVVSLSKDKVLLSIKHCCDCTGIKYGVGVTLCPFKEGFIESILSRKLGRQFRVKEIECCGTFAEGCLFEAEERTSS